MRRRACWDRAQLIGCWKTQGRSSQKFMDSNCLHNITQPHAQCCRRSCCIIDSSFLFLAKFRRRDETLYKTPPAWFIIHNTLTFKGWETFWSQTQKLWRRIGISLIAYDDRTDGKISCVSGWEMTKETHNITGRFPDEPQFIRYYKHTQSESERRKRFWRQEWNKTTRESEIRWRDRWDESVNTCKAWRDSSSAHETRVIN